MNDTSKITPLPAERQGETQADALVREAYSLLWTDQIMGEPLLPSDLDWMKRAKAYLDSLPSQAHGEAA